MNDHVHPIMQSVLSSIAPSRKPIQRPRVADYPNLNDYFEAVGAYVEKVERALASFQRLRKILEDACDTVDGADGPKPNMAMQILGEWEFRENFPPRPVAREPDFAAWLAAIPKGPEGWDGLTERDLRDLWRYLPSECHQQGPSGK